MSYRKYGNKKVSIGDIVFDSRKEAKRYQELVLLEKAGEISELETQKPFELIPAAYETYERYGKNGKRLTDGKRCIEKACVYKADFVYKDKDGNTVIEDTKGMRTKDYIIKRKLMLSIYGIRIKEV